MVTRLSQQKSPVLTAKCTMRLSDSDYTSLFVNSVILSIPILCSILWLILPALSIETISTLKDLAKPRLDLDLITGRSLEKKETIIMNSVKNHRWVYRTWHMLCSITVMGLRLFSIMSQIGTRIKYWNIVFLKWH